MPMGPAVRTGVRQFRYGNDANIHNLPAVLEHFSTKQASPCMARTADHPKNTIRRTGFDTCVENARLHAPPFLEQDTFCSFRQLHERRKLGYRA